MWYSSKFFLSARQHCNCFLPSLALETGKPFKAFPYLKRNSELEKKGGGWRGEEEEGAVERQRGHMHEGVNDRTQKADNLRSTV